jgi:hypothetical protein
MPAGIGNQDRGSAMAATGGSSEKIDHRKFLQRRT